MHDLTAYGHVTFTRTHAHQHAPTNIPPAMLTATYLQRKYWHSNENRSSAKGERTYTSHRGAIETKKMKQTPGRQPKTKQVHTQPHTIPFSVPSRSAPLLRTRIESKQPHAKRNKMQKLMHE